MVGSIKSSVGYFKPIFGAGTTYGYIVISLFTAIFGAGTTYGYIVISLFTG